MQLVNCKRCFHWLIIAAVNPNIDTLVYSHVIAVDSTERLGSSECNLNLRCSLDWRRFVIYLFIHSFMSSPIELEGN